MGVEALGLGLARLLEGAWGRERDRRRPRLPQLFGLDQTRHDRRADGRRASGARHRPRDHADGLFRPVRARRPAVAMVTASHNDNGWTGVKMGASRPVTFGPEEMARLRDIVIAGELPLLRGRRLRIRRRFSRPLHRRPDRSPEVAAQAQGRRRLRQRHRRRLRAATLERARRRGRSARLRSRLHLPALQSEPRRHADAACDGGGGEGERRRRRARLRRRRRPLRRRRQRGRRDLRRQDRGHAGARPLEAPPERDLRRRRQVDRAVRQPIPSCSPTASRSTSGRPAIPTSSGGCAT